MASELDELESRIREDVETAKRCADPDCFDCYMARSATALIARVRELEAGRDRLAHELKVSESLLRVSDTALINICKALRVPLEWHAEPFPAEAEVLTAIDRLAAEVQVLRYQSLDRRDEVGRFREALEMIASPGTIEDFGNGWAVGLARKALPNKGAAAISPEGKE